MVEVLARETAPGRVPFRSRARARSSARRKHQARARRRALFRRARIWVPARRSDRSGSLLRISSGWGGLGGWFRGGGSGCWFSPPAPPHFVRGVGIRVGDYGVRHPGLGAHGWGPLPGFTRVGLGAVLSREGRAEHGRLGTFLVRAWKDGPMVSILLCVPWEHLSIAHGRRCDAQVGLARGLSGSIHIESAGTGDWHVGHPAESAHGAPRRAAGTRSTAARSSSHRPTSRGLTTCWRPTRKI